jgi:hypothetical protein
LQGILLSRVARHSVVMRCKAFSIIALKCI